MKAAIIVFPGSNREKDMAMALQSVCSKKPDLIWHKDTQIGSYDLIVLPGGFSYGDYLRCGAMAAHSPIMSSIRAQADRGVKILGICNGFQILVETGLLPGALLRNRSLKFHCKRVFLRTETIHSPFTKSFTTKQIINVPVAHGDGQYFASLDLAKELEDHDQIAFRYVDEHGQTTKAANANGSVSNIAGILNSKKNILGMMPHPEDSTQAHHIYKDGLTLFQSLVS